MFMIRFVRFRLTKNICVENPFLDQECRHRQNNNNNNKNKEQTREKDANTNNNRIARQEK